MLTHRRQQQVIADFIHGFKLDVDLDELEESYTRILDLVDGYDSQSAYQQLVRLKMQEEDLAEIIDGILACEPGHRLSFPSLSQIGPEIPKSTWFWEGWIPRGAMTLLAAWPGIGKTYMAQYLAYCVTNRLPAPDGKTLDIRSGNVIYVDAEQFLADIYERGLAWGMKMDKIFPLQHPPREMIDMNDPKYQNILNEMCYDLRPDLVVVDSLSSINSRGENNIEDIRCLLSFLVDLAVSLDFAMKLIHHLRKPTGQPRPISMHDLRGSGHLVAMGRSFLGLDLLNLNDPNSPRLLKILKKNRGRSAKPISIQFADAPGNSDVAQLSFGDIQVEQVTTQTEQCADWLIEILADEERSWKELIELGKEEGFGRMTILRARESLSNYIIDTAGAHRADNKWALNPEILPDSGDESHESQEA